MASERQRSRAGAKLVCFNTQMIEQVHKEIAERRIARCVMGNVTSVFIAAAGQQDRKIARVMCVRVSKVAPEQHGRSIQERVTRFGNGRQLGEQVGITLQDLLFNDLQLLNLLGILTVMRQVVVLDGHTLNLGYVPVILNHNGNDS